MQWTRGQRPVLPHQSIQNSQLGEGAVEERAIAAGAVTSSKLGAAAVSETAIAPAARPLRRVKAAAPAAITTGGAQGSRSSSVITANVNGDLNTAALFDGVTLAVGDRVMLFAETGGTKRDNGVYTVTSLGSGGSKWTLTRAEDEGTADKFPPGTLVHVQSGTLYGSYLFKNDSATGYTMNTSDITLQQIPVRVTSSMIVDETVAEADIAPGARSVRRVRAVATAQITTGGASGTRSGDVITGSGTNINALGAFDGVSLLDGDRVLLYLESGGQADDNGVYTVTNIGEPGTPAPWVLTRATDSNSAADLPSGALVYVQQGTLHGGQFFKNDSASDYVMNTSDITFTRLPQNVQAAQMAAQESTRYTAGLLVRSHAFVSGGAAEVALPGGAFGRGVRIVDVILYVSTAVGGSTCTLRNSTDGADISDAIDSATTGRKQWDVTGAAGLALDKALSVLRSDAGVAGRIVIHYYYET